jgi:hypothetical protein
MIILITDEVVNLLSEQKRLCMVCGETNLYLTYVTLHYGKLTVYVVLGSRVPFTAGFFLLSNKILREFFPRIFLNNH